MRNRPLAALLAALLTFSLAACGKKGGKADSAEDVDTWDFQKNTRQSQCGDLDGICETGEGFYLNCDLGPGLKFRLYYLDRATGKVTVLCGKPDCDHTDPDTCDSLVDALGLWTDGARLYYVRAERGGDKRVYSQALNGAERREVMDLGAAAYDRPIYHRGEVYFVSGGVIYAVKPGGGLRDARRIWGREQESEDTGGGYAAYDPDAPRYTLWADGDALYFMVNVPQEGGTQKDTLFSCPLEGGEAKKVWQTPDADEVGPWETTGVRVSQWYVTGGNIYFYLSGGGFWKTDLASGETVKLADTSEKTLYGSAVFSDDHLCLLNDQPMTNPFDGTLMVGGPLHEGGDTVLVYDLKGTLLAELSLEPLMEEPGQKSSFALLFCDRNMLYFNATAGRDPSTTTLCSLDLTTGEITQIYNWQ